MMPGCGLNHINPTASQGGATAWWYSIYPAPNRWHLLLKGLDNRGRERSQSEILHAERVTLTLVNQRPDLVSVHVCLVSVHVCSAGKFKRSIKSVISALGLVIPEQINDIIQIGQSLRTQYPNNSNVSLCIFLPPKQIARRGDLHWENST